MLFIISWYFVPISAPPQGDSYVVVFYRVFDIFFLFLLTSQVIGVCVCEYTVRSAISRPYIKTQIGISISLFSIGTIGTYIIIIIKNKNNIYKTVRYELPLLSP